MTTKGLLSQSRESEYDRHRSLGRGLSQAFPLAPERAGASRERGWKEPRELLVGCMGSLQASSPPSHPPTPVIAAQCLFTWWCGDTGRLPGPPNPPTQFPAQAWLSRTQLLVPVRLGHPAGLQLWALCSGAGVLGPTNAALAPSRGSAQRPAFRCKMSHFPAALWRAQGRPLS